MPTLQVYTAPPNPATLRDQPPQWIIMPLNLRLERLRPLGPATDVEGS